MPIYAMPQLGHWYTLCSGSYHLYTPEKPDNYIIDASRKHYERARNSLKVH